MIEITNVVDVLDRVLNLSDIGQPDRRIVAPGHDQGLVIRRLPKLVVGRDHPAMTIIFQKTLWLSRVRCSDGRSDRIQRDTVLRQGIGVELDAYGGQRATANLHLTYTLYLRQFLLDGSRGDVIELTLRQGRGRQGQRHDGRGRGIRFPKRRITL